MSVRASNSKEITMEIQKMLEFLFKQFFGHFTLEKLNFDTEAISAHVFWSYQNKQYYQIYGSYDKSTNNDWNHQQMIYTTKNQKQ